MPAAMRCIPTVLAYLVSRPETPANLSRCERAIRGCLSQICRTNHHLPSAPLTMEVKESSATSFYLAA